MMFDWQMLERSQTPISIDNIHHTLKTYGYGGPIFSKRGPSQC